MAKYLQYEIVTKTLKKHTYQIGLSKSIEVDLPPEMPKIEDAPAQVEVQKPDIKEISKKKRKISIFEESNNEDLYKKAEEIINEDHYYDEILPYDYGLDFTKRKKRKVSLAAIIGIAALFIFAIIMLTVNLKKIL